MNLVLTNSLVEIQKDNLERLAILLRQQSFLIFVDWIFIKFMYGESILWSFCNGRKNRTNSLLEEYTTFQM